MRWFLSLPLFIELLANLWLLTLERVIGLPIWSYQASAWRAFHRQQLVSPVVVVMNGVVISILYNLNLASGVGVVALSLLSGYLIQHIWSRPKISVLCSSIVLALLMIILSKYPVTTWSLEVIVFQFIGGMIGIWWWEHRRSVLPLRFHKNLLK